MTGVDLNYAIILAKNLLKFILQSITLQLGIVSKWTTITYFNSIVGLFGRILQFIGGRRSLVLVLKNEFVSAILDVLAL